VPTPVPAPPPEPDKKYMTFVCALSRPLSRGSVHIASSDPLASPLIDPNSFGNEADLDFYVHILRYLLKLERTEPLRSAVKKIIMPAEETLQKGRDGLVEYLKENCQQLYHPVGTVPMMLQEDGGVVDSSLKVYGTINLRVVDLSVLPVVRTQSQSDMFGLTQCFADVCLSHAVSCVRYRREGGCLNRHRHTSTNFYSLLKAANILKAEQGQVSVH
jgi:choline dehydrogenase-like flavoprotein